MDHLLLFSVVLFKKQSGNSSLCVFSSEHPTLSEVKKIVCPPSVRMFIAVQQKQDDSCLNRYFTKDQTTRLH